MIITLHQNMASIQLFFRRKHRFSLVLLNALKKVLKKTASKKLKYSQYVSTNILL